jgi:cell division protein FtsW
MNSHSAHTNSASNGAGHPSATSGHFLLLFLMGVFCAFGLMMVLSSSSVDSLRIYGSSWVFFKRQVLWIILGSIALYTTLRIDYQFWRKWRMPLLVGSAALLFIVLIPGIGIKVSGSRRWLGFGSLNMQPSELAKFALLVFSADLLARRQHLLGNWRVGLAPVGAVFLAFALLVMLEPDMGTTMCMGAIVVAVLFVGGIPLKFMGRAGIGVVLAATFLAIVEPYRRARLMSFTHPFDDASGGGYQVVQSIIGIGSGGITGVGLGASTAKWGFLPNAHTDFIFAIIAEELGLVGAIAVVAMFVAFACIGVRTATRAPDQFGVLMASGITAWVVFQAFLNLGAVIGVLPVTGVPLPFLSQGGSSLVVLMAATGILANIARQGEQHPPKRRAAHKSTAKGTSAVH